MNDTANVACCVVLLVGVTAVYTLFVYSLLILTTSLVYRVCCIIFFVEYLYVKFKSVRHSTYLLHEVLDYGLTVMTVTPVFISVTLQ